MDSILVNGQIWTGVKQSPFAQALAIKDGKIAAVGSTEAIQALSQKNTEVTDLNGHLALPGFIDNHTHFMTGGFYLLSIDLRDAKDQQDFGSRIAAKAASLPPGRWLTGGNWDHQSWPEATLPAKELIDSSTANTPVFVTRLDLHMGLANTLALKIAGITKETPDPPGGVIVRDRYSGELTGLLKDTAMELVRQVIPRPSEAEYTAALQAALNYAARLGITSVQDITAWEDWPLYLRFNQQDKLSVRIYARTIISEWKKHLDTLAAYGPGNDWLRLGGLKGFVDGSLGAGTALFFEPYTDAPGNCGLLFEQMYPEGIMQQRIAAADQAGLPVSVHAIGDKANHILLNIFTEVMKANGPKDRRFRIEHAQHLTNTDIARMAGLGVIASVQPYHLIDDGRWAEKKIGKDRCQNAFPFRGLLDAGVMLTFGSDWPVAPPSPLLGIYAAVTRRTIDGQFPDGWIPQQKFSVEEAIRAYTVNGAYAEFAEHTKGILEPGKLADIIILSADIFAIDPADIPAVEVLQTIVGGKIVYCK